MAKATPRQIHMAIEQEVGPFIVAVDDYWPTEPDIGDKDRQPSAIHVLSGTPAETRKMIRKTNQSHWGWIIGCMKSFGDC